MQQKLNNMGDPGMYVQTGLQQNTYVVSVHVDVQA
jgi:hypothetical protein